MKMKQRLQGMLFCPKSKGKSKEIKNRREEGKEMEFEKLQNIIAEVLNIEADEVTMNATFVDDLGADSLDVFQIVMGIEEEFDIEIPTEVAENIVSVSDAVEQIKNALN